MSANALCFLEHLQHVPAIFSELVEQRIQQLLYKIQTLGYMNCILVRMFFSLV